MLKPLYFRPLILLCLIFFGCKQEFPAIKVDIEDYKKEIKIFKNGKVLKEIANEVTFPPELQLELNSMVSYDIDSLNQVLYINNYAKDLLAISIENGQILQRSSLEEIDYDGAHTHGKLKRKVFHVKKYRDKVLLITDMDVLVYNEKLQLQKKLLDSVTVKNPRIIKGFFGSFDYTLEKDSVKLIYNIESYRYGLNDLSKSVIVEDYSFKL